MNDLTASAAEQLIRDGIDALRRGHSDIARKHFAEVINSEVTIPKPHFLMAQACRHSGDRGGEIHALELLLATEPNHLGGLLMMGNAKAAVGDDRAASSFYKSALGIASGAPDVPAGLHPLLDHAQSWLQHAQQQFASHLRTELEKSGITRSSMPPRAADAVSLLLGETQLYLQQPTMFYFPGLPQRQFFERSEFPWLAEMEAEVPAMQEELYNLLDGGEIFDPYIQTNMSRPKSINPLADDNSWGAWYFWHEGKRVTANVAQCPRTAAALELAPMPLIETRSPMALYSVLEPGTHIIPHHGALNTRLICHIPLIAPKDCAIRVGSETRSWHVGETLIFDDSIEHEAWNKGSDTRIILLFDIWRPEINEDERQALTAVFESVERYNPGALGE